MISIQDRDSGYNTRQVEGPTKSDLCRKIRIKMPKTEQAIPTRYAHSLGCGLREYARSKHNYANLPRPNVDCRHNIMIYFFSVLELK